MIKLILGLVIIFTSAPHAIGADMSAKSAHDFTFEDINGKQVSLSEFSGKVLMIVNTASECGFTGQYEGMQALQEKYGKKSFSVIAVPSNDFGGQEPGDASQIKEFCDLRFNITFPLMNKVSVKGKQAHPFFQWAANQDGMMSPKWNFHKYIVDKNGNLVDYYSSITKPESSKITSKIESLL